MGAQAKDRTIRLLVDRCVNTASFDVTQSGDALGGLVGRFSHAAIGTIRNSRNTGDIQAPNYTYVGGLVGYIGPYMPSIGGGVQIENSANYGSVSGKDAGGLVGEFNTNTGWASGQMVVNNSASYGTVTGTDAAGGVVSKVVCAGKGPVAFDNCLTAGISYQTATNLEPTPSNMLDLASESYDAQAALAALNGVAVENPAYVPWVMGTDHPELALFASAADPVVLYCDWDGSLLAKGEEPETPQRTGFVFAGWREITDADAGCSMWVAEYEPVSCRVSFDFENGQPVLVKSFDYEAVVKFPSDPTRDGYTFCGWARRMAVEDARLVTGDIDYTAIWKKVKQPALAKLRVLQWTLSGDTRHRAAIAAELKAQFDAENPDVFISCGSEQSQAFVDVLAAAIPDYTFVYVTGNGSADCGARLFAWKTARFEAADVVKEMFISNATTGWIPLREKGTENYYVLMSAFSGTTKNMTEYFNALPAFYTKIRAKHPTATFILGANYEKFKDAPSATIFESTYESDPAKVMSDLEERTDFTHVQAGDDFQWLLYQSAYDPIDVEVGAVKRFNGEQNSRFGNVVSFKFGRAPGFIVSIR